jgi:hypothetical protein
VSARRPIEQAFDELRFGESRTLNLRDALPTGAEAARRTEAWLRQKQVERVGDVLVVTGRGKSSEGGVSVVREEVVKLFGRLRRANVITSVREHTAGSFVVLLAPMRALFDGAQTNPAPTQERPRDPRTLAGLSAETRARLRHLATLALEALGVQRPGSSFLHDEMHRLFATLSATADSDASLRAAIDRAIEEYEESRE